jgi:hypothetical protein
MLFKTFSAAVFGIDTYLVEVDVSRSFEGISTSSACQISPSRRAASVSSQRSGTAVSASLAAGRRPPISARKAPRS